jgi:dsDNA-specific endonuclease/ATPase MutS2
MTEDRKGRAGEGPGPGLPAGPSDAAGDPIELPIDGVLDLHTFSPKEVKDLVPEYIGECLRRGLFEIRIIHGKGTGTLKAIVHALLEKDPRVAGFRDADSGAGGWGATIVRLAEPDGPGR